MMIKIVIATLGSIIMGFGFFYKKEDRKKYFVNGYSSAVGTNDRLIGNLLFFSIGFFFSILSWYITKMIIIVVGLFLIIVSILYIT